MKVKNYKKYLLSDHWTNKKTELEKFLKGKECFVCGSKKKMNTHHRTYKRITEENIDTDLVFLCRKCHIVVHKIAKEKEMNIWNATQFYKSNYVKKNGFKWGKKEIKDYWLNKSIGLLGK